MDNSTFFTEAGEAEQVPHGNLSSAFIHVFLHCPLPFIIGQVVSVGRSYQPASFLLHLGLVSLLVFMPPAHFSI